MTRVHTFIFQGSAAACKPQQKSRITLKFSWIYINNESFREFIFVLLAGLNLRPMRGSRVPFLPRKNSVDDYSCKACIYKQYNVQCPLPPWVSLIRQGIIILKNNLLILKKKQWGKVHLSVIKLVLTPTRSLILLS